MPARSRKVWLSLLAPLLLVAGVSWWGWLRAPTLADLQTAADGIGIPAEFELAEEKDHPRSLWCSDVPCPSVLRRWEGPRLLTPTELGSILVDAGWRDVALEGDCQPSPNVTGPHPLCRAVSTSEDLEATLRLLGPLPDPEGTYWLVLSVTTS